MTFKEFKEIFELKLTLLGGKSKPETAEQYSILIKTAIRSISRKVIPIDLYTNDVTKKVQRQISGSHFIRETRQTEYTDDTKIDIDEELHDAVIYYILAEFVNTEKSYILLNKMDKEINAYKWNNYHFLEEIGANK